MVAEVARFKFSTIGNREYQSTRISKVSPAENGPHKSTTTDNQGDYDIGIGIIGVGDDPTWFGTSNIPK